MSRYAWQACGVVISAAQLENATNLPGVVVAMVNELDKRGAERFVGEVLTTRARLDEKSGDVHVTRYWKQQKI